MLRAVVKEDQQVILNHEVLLTFLGVFDYFQNLLLYVLHFRLFELLCDFCTFQRFELQWKLNVPYFVGELVCFEISETQENEEVVVLLEVCLYVL